MVGKTYEKKIKIYMLYITSPLNLLFILISKTKTDTKLIIVIIKINFYHFVLITRHKKKTEYYSI